uniref:Uncharacterized protein n=1 Tax=Lynx canadensis TaxID=61383 RepID=A0A667I053_LYNCA
MDTNKCASQSGMIAYGTRSHLYDPKNHILLPVDHSTISLLIGTNKYASQMGITAPGTHWHMYNTRFLGDCGVGCQEGSRSPGRGPGDSPKIL